MIKSLAALDSMEAQFTAVRNARPAELDTSPPGFEGVSYETLSDLFTNWRESLEDLKRTRWAETTAGDLPDAVISRQVAKLSALIAQGSQHGAVWLLVSSGFPESVVDVGQRISLLADRRTGIVKHLGKELARRGLEEVAVILEAAPVAQELNAKAKRAEATLAELGVKTEATDTLLAHLTESSTNLATLQAEITSAHNSVTESRGDASSLHAEIVEFRASAESKAVQLDKRIIELNSAAGSSDTVVREAVEHLREALSDVRRKGLAEAFAGRAKKILHERGIWLFVFVGAAGGLVLTAQTFVADINAFTYEALTVAFLRRAALAAPLIWLGWYAAKQVGRLNRVHEDYEYKAATALAFESYRNEVASSNDDSLMADLLKSTITNFGENPVRLYDHAAKESGSPTEELLSKLESDGTIKILSRLNRLWGGKVDP